MRKGVHHAGLVPVSAQLLSCLSGINTERKCQHMYSFHMIRHTVFKHCYCGWRCADTFSLCRCCTYRLMLRLRLDSRPVYLCLLSLTAYSVISWIGHMYRDSVYHFIKKLNKSCFVILMYLFLLYCFVFIHY